MKRYLSLKKIGAAVLSLTLLFGLAAPALAAESSATYRGRTSLFGFVPDDGSATGLFNNLQGLMPGETRTQKITVDNTSGTRVNIYLRGEPVSPLPSNSQVPSLQQVGNADDILDRITFVLKDGSTTLAEGKLSDIWPETGGTNTGSGRFINLGRFNSGDYKVLTLELDVPAELGNEYQNATGKVRWVFQADVYVPDDDDDDDPRIPLGPPIIIIDEGNPIPLSPGTGDDTNLYIWAGGFILLAGALAVLIVKRRKAA